MRKSSMEEAENIVERFVLGNWKLRRQLYKLMKQTAVDNQAPRWTFRDKLEIWFIAAFTSLTMKILGKEEVRKYIEGREEDDY